MRSATLVLAVALTAGTTEARADMLHFNMTGTVTSQTGGTTGFLVGDHIAWTLYLDRSAPMTSSTSTSSSYSPPIPPISGIEGTTVPNFVPSYGTINSLTLSNSWGSPPAGNLYASDTTINGAHRTALSLMVNGPLPSLNLANIQLNNIPFELGKGGGSYLSYYFDSVYGIQSFKASVDSISGPVPYAPEPGSLTLFVLGATGIAAYGVRRSRFRARFLPCRCRRWLTH